MHDPADFVGTDQGVDEWRVDSESGRTGKAPRDAARKCVRLKEVRQSMRH